MRGGLAAALSWLAGLGKADSFVPASEQSVKKLHNLLLAVASSTYFLTASHFRTTWVIQGWSPRDDQDIGPITFVTVSSGFSPDFVSLDFHFPDDTNCHCFVL
jgi:hypothetical protein